MPHDIKGAEIKKGDIVSVRCEVTEVHAGEEYCNLNLATVEPMYPGTNKTAIVVNAKQVEKEAQS